MSSILISSLWCKQEAGCGIVVGWWVTENTMNKGDVFYLINNELGLLLKLLTITDSRVVWTAGVNIPVAMGCKPTRSNVNVTNYLLTQIICISNQLLDGSVVIWGLSRVFGLWGHSHDGRSSLHHHHWHGTLAWTRGLLFQGTEVCVACRRGGKSIRAASITLVKSIMPGKAAYSVVVEKTLFPALHGTLVKVGGHLIQRTEECEARHKHKNSTHTQLHDISLHREMRALVQSKGEMLLDEAGGGMWLMSSLWQFVS